MSKSFQLLFAENIAMECFGIEKRDVSVFYNMSYVNSPVAFCSFRCPDLKMARDVKKITGGDIMAYTTSGWESVYPVIFPFSNIFE